MGTLSRLLVLGLVLVNSLAFAACDNPDLEKALLCLKRVKKVKEIFPKDDPKIPAGYRRMEIGFEQPVDHFNPKLGTFVQKLALLHKDNAEPMVLQTSGYQIFTVALTELARVYGANQLQVEHRFFDQSIPADQDWSKMNIVQAAYDFHRITEAFKEIYQKRWVNTGASKGGMTSVFHRRFFPNDLDGTVSDVAPLSFSNDDARYIQFVEEAGGAKYKSCREQLKALQIGMLKRRDELMAGIGGSFVYLGGKSVSYEHAVIELPFAFWQYKDPEDPKFGCKNVPAPDARSEDILSYLEEVNSISSYADAGVFSFMPYYFQAATQLGSPAAGLKHLNGLRKHPYRIDQYTPHTAHYGYSNAWMRDVKAWVQSQADHILFVYGEFDPWSAGAYPKVAAKKDMHWFEVPAGNHSSKIFKLPAAEKEKALAIVSVWMGKKNSLRHMPAGEASLDELELQFKRGGRLP